MPTVGRPGQPGFREFPYTAKGRVDAKAYAKEKGLPLHSESVAAGGLGGASRAGSSRPRKPSGRMNVPSPSTRRY